MRSEHGPLHEHTRSVDTSLSSHSSQISCTRARWIPRGGVRLPPSVCASFVVVAVAPPMQAPVTSSLLKHCRVALSTKNTKSSTPPSFPLSFFPTTPSHSFILSPHSRLTSCRQSSGSLLLHALPHILTSNSLRHTITAKRRVSMRSITSSTAAAAFMASMAAISSAQSNSAGMYTRH